MPPATITSAEPAFEHVGREDRRLHARSAHLVDGHRFGRARQARAERRLARRRLAEAGGKHVAHEHLVDLLAADPGALDRRLDRGRAELGRAGAATARPGSCPSACGVGEDDDRVGCRWWPFDAPESDCCSAHKTRRFACSNRRAAAGAISGLTPSSARFMMPALRNGEFLMKIGIATFALAGAAAVFGVSGGVRADCRSAAARLRRSRRTRI